MSPVFLTKVDTPNLYPGPSTLVWSYHLSTRISVNQYCSSNTQHSVNTLSKITHRRIYLLCRGHHNAQWSTRRLHDTENTGISALLKGYADLSSRDRSITRQLFLGFGLIGRSKFLFYSVRTSDVTRRYPGKPEYRHQTRTELYLKVSKNNCVDAIVCKSQFLAVRDFTSFRCTDRKISLGRLMSVPGGGWGKVGGRSKTGHVRIT